MKVVKISQTVLLLSLFIISCDEQGNDPAEYDGNVTLTTAEKELYDLIIDYRSTLGLGDIPLSSSLTYVAQQHVNDLVENNPTSNNCNLHSWSDKGNWSACCYTADHAEAACMWDKPRELTDYTGNGYEIAYFQSNEATPEEALSAWQNSSAHNDVILNNGSWSNKWNAIGLGIRGKYAVVWFGNEEDPTGEPSY